MSISDIGYCPHCGTTHHLGEWCPIQPPTIMSRCTRHNSYFFGPSCYLCDEDARRAGRDVISMLEARISDQGAELLDLRRQVNALLGIVQSLQDHIGRLAAHIEPSPDLLP